MRQITYTTSFMNPQITWNEQPMSKSLDDTDVG